MLLFQFFKLNQLSCVPYQIRNDVSSLTLAFVMEPLSHRRFHLHVHVLSLKKGQFMSPCRLETINHPPEAWNCLGRLSTHGREAECFVLHVSPGVTWQPVIHRWQMPVEAVGLSIVTGTKIFDGNALTALTTNSPGSAAEWKPVVAGLSGVASSQTLTSRCRQEQQDTMCGRWIFPNGVFTFSLICRKRCSQKHKRLNMSLMHHIG